MVALMRQCLILFACLSLLACANSGYVPTVERKINTLTSVVSYQVKPGDTLYSIAWRYGLDYKQLAQWNTINPPYVIYPRQRLWLQAIQARKVTGTEISIKATTKSQLKAKSRSASKSKVKPQSSIKVAKNLPSNIISQSQSNPLTTKKVAKKSEWQWPVLGKVSNASELGVDIIAKLNSPVVAIAQGEVVYSGHGLADYGELIIIKHANQYVSAYGNNKIRLVKEGAKIQQGQQIAILGKGQHLRLELRENGKSVNPLLYLPR